MLQDFLKKNFKLIKRRVRTTYAELDLILESPDAEIWLVEVKTLTHFDFITTRVSKKQLERLKRAHSYLQARSQKPLRLVLSFVDANANILTIEDF